jgi:hypothetical protein
MHQGIADCQLPIASKVERLGFNVRPIDNWQWEIGNGSEG